MENCFPSPRGWTQIGVPRQGLLFLILGTRPIICLAPGSLLGLCTQGPMRTESLRLSGSPLSCEDPTHIEPRLGEVSNLPCSLFLLSLLPFPPHFPFFSCLLPTFPPILPLPFFILFFHPFSLSFTFLSAFLPPSFPSFLLFFLPFLSPSLPCSPKDAFRAVKKRISGNKNFHEVMLALTVSPLCPSLCPIGPLSPGMPPRAQPPSPLQDVWTPTSC